MRWLSLLLGAGIILPTSGSTTAGAAPLASCGSLQTLIDSAPPGSTATVPACLYREQVTISKALTLVAEPGAEIRGSRRNLVRDKRGVASFLLGCWY